MYITTRRIVRHMSWWLAFGITGLAHAADTLPDANNQTPSASLFKLPPDQPATLDAPVTKPLRIVPPPGSALMAPKSGGASISTVPLIPHVSKQNP